MKIWNFATAGAAVLLAAFTGLAVAGCGEGAGNSTSAASTTKAANAATTPTTTSTASTATTSTAAKAPAPKRSHTTSTPAKAPSAHSHAAAAAKEKLLRKKLSAGKFGAIKLTSSAFKPGGPIDVRYTCDGSSISPSLHWNGVPRGAAQLFLLAADIGGGTNSAVQWAVAMPPSTTEIPAGSLPAGAVVGVNSAGKVGWGGVCGTKGKLQHVTFLMYALSHKLGLQTGFSPSQVGGALKGGYVATGFTVATNRR